ncbi:hypothetical protein C8R48DRAFT_768506 [Suillus tomentosus]|nr:hypothetical protein C8R48DRAFT_768506 [Suillus tomentosus]
MERATTVIFQPDSHGTFSGRGAQEFRLQSSREFQTLREIADFPGAHTLFGNHVADYIVLNSLQYQAYGHRVTHATPYQLLYSICSHFSLHAGHSHDRHLPIGSPILPNDAREIRSPCLVAFGRHNEAGALLLHYQSVLPAHLNMSSSPPLFECNFRDLGRAVAQLRATLDAHNAAHMESAPPSTNILGPFCMPLTVGQAAVDNTTTDLPLVQVANGNLSPSPPQSQSPSPSPSPSSPPFLHRGERWYIRPDSALMDFPAGGSQSVTTPTLLLKQEEEDPIMDQPMSSPLFLPSPSTTALTLDNSPDVSSPLFFEYPSSESCTDYSSDDDDLFDEEPVLVSPPSTTIDNLCELLVANDIKECVGHSMPSLVCAFSFDAVSNSMIADLPTYHTDIPHPYRGLHCGCDYRPTIPFNGTYRASFVRTALVSAANVAAKIMDHNVQQVGSERTRFLLMHPPGIYHYNHSDYPARVMRSPTRLWSRYFAWRQLRRLHAKLIEEIYCILTPDQAKDCNEPDVCIILVERDCALPAWVNRASFLLQHAPFANPFLTRNESAFLRSASSYLRFYGYDESSRAIDNILQMTVPDEDIVGILLQELFLDELFGTRVKAEESLGKIFAIHERKHRQDFGIQRPGSVHVFEDTDYFVSKSGA